MNPAQDVPIQPGGTETRHGTAKASPVPQSIPGAGSTRTPLSDLVSNKGSVLYPMKCTALGCSRVFIRPCDRRKHERVHLRPFKCFISTCKRHLYGFIEREELERHIRTEHLGGFGCLYPQCLYIGSHEDNWRRHMNIAHGVSYFEHGHPKSDGNTVVSGSSAENGIKPDFPGPHFSTQFEEQDRRMQVEGRPLTEIRPPQDLVPPNLWTSCTQISLLL